MTAITDKYKISQFDGLKDRMVKVKKVILKRRSAFNVAEWMMIRDVLNITGEYESKFER